MNSKYVGVIVGMILAILASIYSHAPAYNSIIGGLFNMFFADHLLYSFEGVLSKRIYPALVLFIIYSLSGFLYEIGLKKSKKRAWTFSLTLPILNSLLSLGDFSTRPFF